LFFLLLQVLCGILLQSFVSGGLDSTVRTGLLSRFTFEEARKAQTFPESWVFPEQKTLKWKWLAEAFPPKVAQYLFNKYVKDTDLVLLDLFAGIGGWGLGAVWSGKFTKVIMVEWDVLKCKYLSMNFTRLGVDFEVICKDVRQVDFSSIEADVIASSPPCEDLTMLRFFSKNEINKGTIPLTLLTLKIVDEVKPRTAFYENVYRKHLKELLEKHGWNVMRFDMSKIIPQKRIRLIAIKKVRVMVVADMLEEVKREVPRDVAERLGYGILGMYKLIVDFVKKNLCKVENEDFRTDIFFLLFKGYDTIDADSEEYKKTKEWLNKICKEVVE